MTDTDESMQDVTQSAGPGGEAAADAPLHRHLLVLARGSSSIFPLPRAGEIIVGRAPDVELHIDDGSVSRKHATLLLTEDEVRVLDLRSRNGTRVNGEPVHGARALVSGDVIALSPSASLVYHAEPRSRRAPTLQGAAELRGRLGEEVERALRYARPLGVLCVQLAEAADAAVIEGRLLPCLRLIDVSAWDGPRRLILLCPELDPAGQRELAGALREALAPLCGALRIGVASCPEDGSEPDVLLQGARAAAAEPGPVESAAGAARRIEIGERGALVADPAMIRLYDLIDRLAGSDLPVLILGETGTGKELCARALHHRSARQRERFVALNCAALPEPLAESELFGHERGAFSGAHAPKDGLLQAGHRGTVFLDEVAELPLAVQAKLLRVLEERVVLRLGDTRERPVDVRIVAATHRDLEAEVVRGRFRQDLYFRLSGATVRIPPLRQRRRELPILAREFLREAAERAGRPRRLSPAAIHALSVYPWPGNVRELRNVIEFLAATASEEEIAPAHLPERLRAGVGRPPAPGLPAAQPEGAPVFRPIQEELQELERRRMQEALRHTGGQQNLAAALLSMPLRSFVTKMGRYGLREGKDDGGR